jgi:DNA-binding response OmpR family regulator
MRILLAEDDPSLGNTLRSWLELDGYAVDWVERGDLAETALRAQSYDCLLLDRGLPGLDGDTLLGRLRSRADPLAVLMITARDTIAERIEGLDLGADDYLVKPFDLDELSARIRAALRRAAQRPSAMLERGALRLDPAGKQVWRDGLAVSLTIREFTVLHALMLRPTHVLSREQLENALYGWGDEVESNAIEVHIHHLRKKLGAELIRTVRNAGYTLS